MAEKKGGGIVRLYFFWYNSFTLSTSMKEENNYEI